MKKIVTCMLLALSFSAYAYDNNTPSKTVQEESNSLNNSSGFAFSIGHFNLDSDNSAQEGIGDSGTFLKFGWEAQQSHLAYGFGLSGLLLKDNDSFNVTVENNFGSQYSSSSSVDAFGFYGELGYSLPMGESSKFDLMGGIDLLWANRGIANCTDCPSEDVNLDGGLYVEPRLTFVNDGSFNFSIAYRHYPDSDIEGGINLNFSWAN